MLKIQLYHHRNELHFLSKTLKYLADHKVKYCISGLFSTI